MKKIISFVVMIIIIICIPFIIIHFFYDYKLINLKTGFNYNKDEIKIRIKHGEDEIIKLNLEEYLVGVVSSEMPVSFEDEALKAQAVAARTYALKQIENSYNRDYDVTDDTNSQVYQDDNALRKKWNDNYDGNIRKIKKCVNDTSGEYITYNDNIIYAFFFSTSNGMTEDNKNVFGQDLPYLKSVDSSFDIENNSSFYNEKEYSLEDFYNKLDLNYNENLSVTDIKKTESGRVYSLTINGKYFKGREFQKILFLKSNDFEIIKKDRNVIIKTKGYGHGVGMSQYGANALAKQQKNYKEILEYYYRGTKIKKL